MLEREIEIKNPQGIHARPAAMIAEVASRFASQVTFLVKDRQADAKSLLSILTLAVPHGEKILLRVDGPDEELALSALEQLFEEGFGELGDSTLKTV